MEAMMDGMERHAQQVAAAAAGMAAGFAHNDPSATAPAAPAAPAPGPDLQSLIDELLVTDFADLVRNRYMQEIINDLRANREVPGWSEDEREEDRVWRCEVADYLTETYL